jgi:hypothetical protein
MRTGKGKSGVTAASVGSPLYSSSPSLSRLSSSLFCSTWNLERGGAAGAGLLNAVNGDVTFLGGALAAAGLGGGASEGSLGTRTLMPDVPGRPPRWQRLSARRGIAGPSAGGGGPIRVRSVDLPVGGSVLVVSPLIAV